MKHLESQIQQWIIKWCDYNKNKYAGLNLIHHSPNGGRRNALEGARFKREGVRAGFPDLFLPVPKNNFHGLFIEVKTPTGKLTKTQKEWKEFLINNNYAYHVVRNVDEFSAIIEKYYNRES